MYFEYPWRLMFLWLLLPAAALLVYAHLARRRAAQRFVDRVMHERLFPPGAWLLPSVKGILLLLGIGLLIVAAARPKYGVYYEEVAERGADIVFLLDVSRSMTAADTGQSRLSRAKAGIRDLLTRLPGDRVGLVVFAGKPTVKVPLTTDHGFLLAILDQIDTVSAPRGGSRLGDGIRKCLQVLKSGARRDRAIVLFSDGEDHDSSPHEVVEIAKERGVKIFAVGLGDPQQGATIPVVNEAGERVNLKHEGQVVWTILNEQLLNEISVPTGGAYVPAKTLTYDLGWLYDAKLSKLIRTEYRLDKRRRIREQFQWPLVAGIMLIVIEMLIPAYSRPNRLPQHGTARGVTSVNGGI
jgi:Ca-activated chloride channel family protein